MVIREFTQLCAEIRDWRGFKSNILFSFWNWIDWASVALTVSSYANAHTVLRLKLIHIFIYHDSMQTTAILLATSLEELEGSNFKVVCAFATLSQLLHIVGFIRNVNEDISVLIVSLEKVGIDYVCVPALV